MAKVFTRRYAQAIFEIANETKTFDKWQEDLKSLSVISQDSDVVAVLQNPKIRFEEKIKLIEPVLINVSQMARNLAYLLVSRHRAGLVETISKEYQELLDKYNGIEHAEVTTAVPVDEEEKKKILNSLELTTGHKIILTTRIDPAIIGGMVARIGTKLLEGSTAGKLEALKKEMVGAVK